MNVRTFSYPGPQELYNSKHVDMSLNPARRVCITCFKPVAMWLLRYTRYCICDIDPPYKAHVHMFTIIQFLRAMANIHTVLDLFIVSIEQWARK